MIKVKASFPSPAEPFQEKRLDLNDLLVRNPVATFFMKVSGKSMEKAGIFDGDIIIVDRSERIKSGDIIVAVLFDELVVKRFVKRAGRIFLIAENEGFIPVDVTDNREFAIWGKVIYSIHKP